MEFHQRNNPLHPGRRSTGWKTFLVGILIRLSSFLTCTPGSLTSSILHVWMFSYMKMIIIHIFCVPLSQVLLSLEQWFSARGDLPPGDMWQCLETVLIVLTGRDYWHLVGTGQGCCQTYYNAQDTGQPPQTKIIHPKCQFWSWEILP